MDSAFIGVMAEGGRQDGRLNFHQAGCLLIARETWPAGRVRVAQNAITDAKDHRPKTLDEDFKGGLIAMQGKPL